MSPDPETDGAEPSESTPARPGRDPIAKSIRLLAWLADRGPHATGVREIAGAFAMAPSSVHRLLASLEREGLVQRVEGGRYGLGLEFMRLAWLAAARYPAASMAGPILESLATTSGETSLLGLYDANRRQMFYAASAESPQPLRYVINLNEWISVDRGASGLAIAAFLPEDETAAMIRERSEAEGTKAADALRRRLTVTRERGYAASRGERIIGAVGIAAPVYGATGRVIGDIVLTVPEQRFRDRDESRLAGVTVAAATQLTESLRGS